MSVFPEEHACGLLSTTRRHQSFSCHLVCFWNMKELKVAIRLTFSFFFFLEKTTGCTKFSV